MKKTYDCKSCARTSVWLCLIESAFVGFFKVIIGLTSGSMAMLGSALYSITDLISSLLIIITLKISNKKPDKKHPYGYGKIEYIVTMAIALVVMVGTIVLFAVSTIALFRVTKGPPHWIALWAAVASWAINQIMYRLISCVGKQNSSPAILAHAKHIKLDNISNIAVVVAIGAAELGYRMLDPIIAMIEAVHILYECSNLIVSSAKKLMDESAGIDSREEIERIIAANAQVRKVTSVTTRSLGRGLGLDIEILLDSHLTIEKCNEVVSSISRKLKKEISGIHSVNIHYHPVQSNKEREL